MLELIENKEVYFGVKGDAKPRRKRFLKDVKQGMICLLYTSDAADERSSVDLGGRRIIKKKTTDEFRFKRKNSH